MPFRLSVNPIPARGGQFDPPPCNFFLHKSKSIALRLFLNTHSPPFRSKTGLTVLVLSQPA